MDTVTATTRRRALGDLVRGPWPAIAGGVLAVLVVAAAAGADALVIGVITGSAYGLVALGLVLIYKSSGVFNFAQGEFGTVAVYALFYAHQHLPYGAAIVVALAAAAVFGLLVERLVVRPLFDAPRVTLLVATAGVALLAIGLEFWLSGDRLLRNVDPALPTPDRLTLAGIAISDQRLLLLGSLVVLAVLLGLFFSRTNLGLAILGASQEPTATELVGISVKRISTLVWVLAALLGGLAGVLSVPIGKTFTPGVLTTGGLSALIPGFTAAVIGGMTSLPGAFVGGVIVGVAQTAAPEFGVLSGIDNPGTLVVFVLLVAILVARPQGLLGKSA
jgi:branched-chain amino acid transport system permease protein